MNTTRTVKQRNCRITTAVVVIFLMSLAVHASSMKNKVDGLFGIELGAKIEKLAQKFNGKISQIGDNIIGFGITTNRIKGVWSYKEFYPGIIFANKRTKEIVMFSALGEHAYGSKREVFVPCKEYYIDLVRLLGEPFDSTNKKEEGRETIRFIWQDKEVGNSTVRLELQIIECQSNSWRMMLTASMFEGDILPETLNTKQEILGRMRKDKNGSSTKRRSSRITGAFGVKFGSVVKKTQKCDVYSFQSTDVGYIIHPTDPIVVLDKYLVFDGDNCDGRVISIRASKICRNKREARLIMKDVIAAVKERFPEGKLNETDDQLWIRYAEGNVISQIVLIKITRLNEVVLYVDDFSVHKRGLASLLDKNEFSPQLLKEHLDRYLTTLYGVHIGETLNDGVKVEAEESGVRFQIKPPVPDIEIPIYFAICIPNNQTILAIEGARFFKEKQAAIDFAVKKGRELAARLNGKLNKFDGKGDQWEISTDTLEENCVLSIAINHKSNVNGYVVRIILAHIPLIEISNVEMVRI